MALPDEHTSVASPRPDLPAEVLDALPERVARYRLDDRVIVYCNAAWAAGHGTTPQACIDRPLDRLLTPPELRGMHQQLARLGPDTPLLTDPEPRTAPDDTTRWIEWVDRLVPGPAGDEVLSVGRDVTDRHLAQLRARESEQRVRLAMDRAPIGMEIVGLDDRFMEVNDALCAFLGRSADELVGRRWQEVTHPEDIDPDQALIDTMTIEGHPSYSLEKRYLHADGSVRWGLLTGAYVRDPHGEPLYGIGQIVDITDRKRAEIRAARQGALLEMAGSIAHLGGWAWDLETDRVSWSDVICETLGFPIGSQPTFDEVMALYPPEAADAIRVAIDDCLTDGTPWDIEHAIHTRTGRRRWARSVGEARRDEGGRVAQLWGAFQDITDQWEAQQETAWLGEQLTAMLTSTDDGFVTLDHELRITFVNGRGEQIIGLPRDQLLDTKLLERFPHLQATQLPQAFATARAEGRTVTIEREYDPRLEAWFETDVHPTSRGLVLYFRDITHHIQREEALEQSLRLEREAAQRLRTLDQAKNAFLSAVSHELRTPLTVVHGLALSLQRLRGSLNDDVRTQIEDAVVTHADHLRTLLNDLLDVDRLARGSLTASRQPFDASAMIREVASGSAVAARVRLRVPPSLPSDADPVQVERIVRNLLENAGKYAPQGQILLRIERLGTRGLRMEVEDDGPGIPDDALERIFDAFHRLDDEHPQPGTGVGLALVADFARLHGGRAWAENVPDAGARFVVEIPGGDGHADQ